ncbi:hypothetical protein PJN38_19460 [Mycobacterium kansasii]|uniref:Serine/threonine protein kinase n=1 Tax=Mycobacterium pseudokansasii TaxID=2341080 RepID=A0A498QWP6_9MYCO|nr:hypothetical protein [Mycobacterium pseudokansasii]VBA29867.1 hypothetical protein LAUMK35_04557 [Mycobacterium pseudokansasii]VBA31355.1 hypothetical protein LAUMK21_04550 [Mycobacterium pseudokansasii]VBA54027.1 hypothetical protein LAUMK142_04453 [Mycobacterium pseudokansasii]
MIRLSCIVAAVVATAVSTVAPASADPLSDLTGLLPAGYGSGVCKPTAAGAALAAVSCGANSLPGGPTAATYWLFGDDKAMHEAFASALSGPDWTPAACPGMRSSLPIPLTKSDGTRYGSVVCGRASTFLPDRDGGIAWTRDADKLLGVAYVGYQGQAYPAGLFEWVRAQQT